MQFFEQHFTKHHFFHAPHKWFLALLISPIHFAELRYKNRYHLKYENARKLFVLDVGLMLTTLVLLGTTIFWFTYHPEVTNLVYLSIRPTADKVKSGEFVGYQITYKNQSEKKLLSPTLTLTLPKSFVLTNANPEDLFNKEKQLFNLKDINPGETGTLSISGYVYGTPDQNENITALLSYRQNGRKFFEEKNTLLIKTLRGSVLDSKITAPHYLVYQGLTPFSLTLTNTGSQKLNFISTPLTQANGTFTASATSTLGYLENNTWFVETLDPKQSATLTGYLKNNNLTSGKTTLDLTPNIKIDSQVLPQSKTTHEFAIAYPLVQLTGTWANNLEKIKPGETATLQIQITNKGNINLKNGQINIPLSNAVLNIPATKQLNLGTITNQTLNFNKTQIPDLENFKPNQTINLNVQLVINNNPQGGTDLTLSQGLNWQSNVDEVENSVYQADGASPALKIGTQITGTPELRYYTFEGDQLGRGPLPPQVGKETKYWVMIPFTNGTSKVNNLKLTAQLPDFVSWTGKSSVSFGNNVNYDATSHTVSWNLNSLNAHTQAGVYFELSFIPSASQVGTSPTLIKNINLTANDTYLETTLNKNWGDLDISLKGDALGQSKGTQVIN